MGFSAVRRSRSRPRGGTVAVLDVGTSKIVCFIARLDEAGQPQIAGIGHQISRGVKAGIIIDMEAAEKAIGHAVHAAEQMAEETVREVLVNLSGGHPTSQTIDVQVAISGHEVTGNDVKRAMKAQNQAEVPDDMEVVHAIPVGFTLDDHRGIRDPRGMTGDRLGLELHVVTAGSAAIRNLVACVERAHLGVESIVVSPYAAGLACLVEDEMDLGSAIIDLGGGTTGIAVFVEGRMVFVDSVPVGGHHVTSDLARGLTTPLVHAERMKTLYGSAIANVSDEREIIDVPQVGEDEPAQANHVQRSILTGIIQPRMEEIFELVRGRLEASGFDRVAGRRVVLTGGGSQLQGVRELAQLVLDKQVRIGRPAGLAGLAEATAGPAFSTATGLLAYAVRQQDELGPGGFGEDELASGGMLSRLGGWIRDYF